MDCLAVFDEHLHHLFDHGAPPPTVRIFIGQYRPGAGETANAASAGIGRGGRIDFPTYKVIFHVGHALFEVAGYAGLEPTGLEMNHLAWGSYEGSRILIPLNDIWRPLWPTEETLEWPPAGGAVNTASLEECLVAVEPGAGGAGHRP